jgi:Zn-dependent protease/predicted transcriptional regulator
VKWSWKVTRVAGIDIYVHATFFILIGWVALNYWQAEASWPAVASGVGFVLALFSCVILHELGHSLTARRYGIRTRHITLLPIGGVAMLERMPDDPKEEMIVALAGPAVNVVIALGLWFWITLIGDFTPVDQISISGASFLERLFAINVMLAVFNMLPALPMDGGRVYRAALAMRMDHEEATQKAAKLGQILALMLGLVGLFYSPILIFIALFVWIGAAAELQSSEVKSATSGVTVGQIMLTDYHTLSNDESLSDVVELTLDGSQRDFPVLTQGRVEGVLTQADLLRGLKVDGASGRVEHWMQRDICSVDINTALDSFLEQLQNPKQRLHVVTDAGQLVGIVNMDNFVEFVRIQNALKTTPRNTLPRQAIKATTSIK